MSQVCLIILRTHAITVVILIIGCGQLVDGESLSGYAVDVTQTQKGVIADDNKVLPRAS